MFNFFDVIVFGSGTKDTYMILDPKNKTNGDGMCFSYGAKIDAKEIKHTTGGGGTNVACALNKIGLKSSWWGAVGQDQEGDNVLNDLKNFGVDFKMAKICKEKPTNQSVILMYPGSERTILTYRGASNHYFLQDLNFSKLKSKWIYIAPFGGKTLDIMEPILKHANQKNIKTMLNPGGAQIEYIKNRNLEILSLIDILSINMQEASMFSGKQDINEMIKELSKSIKDILIITDGENGCCVYEKKTNKLYKAGVVKTEIIDMTGAGDSFNSGFLAGYIQKNDIAYAIALGSAQSAYNIQNWGAKFNLLDKKDNWPKVDVSVSDFDSL